MDLSVEFARDFSRESICRENCIAQVFCLDLYNYVFCITKIDNKTCNYGLLTRSQDISTQFHLK